MKRTECPACASEFSRHKFVISSFQINQCINCKSLFVEEVPPEEQLHKIYQDSRYYALDHSSEVRIRQENLRRINAVMQLTGKGKILDVGCASGLFLDIAKELGFETHGIEWAKQNANKAAQKGHILYENSLESFTNQFQHRIRFDVVVCLDVIEHAANPYQFMILLKKCLGDQGLLVISTPNFSGFVARFLGNKNPFFIPPEHLNFFSSRGLAILGQRCGLKAKKKVTFGRLTDVELNRGARKYLPDILIPLGHLSKPLVNHAFQCLNRFQLGVELEYYFTKNET